MQADIKVDSQPDLPDDFKKILDSFPGFVWSGNSEGSIHYINKKGLEFTGYSLEEVRRLNFLTSGFIHPDDTQRVKNERGNIIASGKPGEFQTRLRRHDGEYFWFLNFLSPFLDKNGKVIEWWGLNINIDERKKTEDELKRSKGLLAEAQKLSRTGSFSIDLSTKELRVSDEIFSIIGYEEGTKPELEESFERVHPDERQKVKETFRNCMAEGKRFDHENRMVMSDGSIKYIHVVADTIKFNSGSSEFVGAVSDITQMKLAEEELRSSKARFEGILEIAEDAIISTDSHHRIILFNQGAEKIFRYTQAEIVGNPLELLLPKRFRNIHRSHIEEFAQSPELTRTVEHRRGVIGLRKDGSEFPAEASISKLNLNDEQVFTVFLRDITLRIKAEQEVRQKEKEFRQIVETVPCLIIIMTPMGEFLYANSNLLNYTGHKQEDVILENFREQIFHPADFEHMKLKREQVLREAKPFETETRILGKDGKYRWFLIRFSPLKDENAVIIQWCATAIDIDDRKQREEKIHNENIVLREEIGKDSNKEIVGTSKEIQNIYHLITLVASTNSSVLILGETGTGKELVARAIHNASNRRNKIMIKVNCAALPANLIESELFGHEKGSFTGAIERRIGKFELADNSTLFLDEIGEMPIDLQVKLLRAIQEKEIERIGGKESIKVNVRIIAASNRNLQNEVKEGKFRSDLYYRLNVFPILIPSLRERKDDIPILSNHFLAKSAKNIGKKINSISAEVMEELISYNWPGNVRELEHLIERSVILNNDIIKEIHLPQIERNELNVNKRNAVKTIHENERDHILSVLKRCNGKKGGTDGAAALLGIPVSTLNSKIKKLGITKENIYSNK